MRNTTTTTIERLCAHPDPHLHPSRSTATATTAATAASSAPPAAAARTHAYAPLLSRPSPTASPPPHGRPVSLGQPLEAVVTGQRGHTRHGIRCQAARLETHVSMRWGSDCGTSSWRQFGVSRPRRASAGPLRPSAHDTVRCDTRAPARNAQTRIQHRRMHGAWYGDLLA